MRYYLKRKSSASEIHSYATIIVYYSSLSNLFACDLYSRLPSPATTVKADPTISTRRHFLVLSFLNNSTLPFLELVSEGQRNGISSVGFG